MDTYKVIKSSIRREKISGCPVEGRAAEMFPHVCVCLHVLSEMTLDTACWNDMCEHVRATGSCMCQVPHGRRVCVCGVIRTGVQQCVYDVFTYVKTLRKVKSVDMFWKVQILFWKVRRFLKRRHFGK